jgi:hypothetical protein
MAHSVQELEKQIHYLEYANDQMLKELAEADVLLRRIGFDNGLQTVKETAKEIIRIQQERKEQKDDPGFYY